jgi:hypothetical protein
MISSDAFMGKLGMVPYAAHAGGYAGCGHAATTSYNQQYAAAGHVTQQAPGTTAHVQMRDQSGGGDE